MKIIPVVVILGHIDHGKSSLLEAIKRDFKITEKESGGITQHIGAYEVDFEGGKITFVDTPGHEAFSEMRSRGAKLADIAILVVAADEGVMPQTKEAIRVIKEAKIPAIVALNKIDKPEADPPKVKGELQKEGILIEEWGGETPLVETSAKTDKGIKELLSMISLITEVSEVKKDPNKKAKGVVIESYLNSSRGPTATIVLEDGKLKVNDIIATETTFGKIKQIFDFKMALAKEIIAGQAGVVIGLEGVPEVGEVFEIFDSVEEARRYLESSQQGQKTVEKEETPREGAIPGKFFKVILKTDVKGSLEVLSKIFKKLKEEDVSVKILKSGVGEITDSDIRLADTQKVSVIGFRVRPNAVGRSLAQQKDIKILSFDIIYDVIDSIRKLMRRMIEIKREKIILGRIKISVIFKTQKRGEKKYRQIAGGRVIDGEIKRGNLEVVRGEKIMGGGKIIEIQEQKRNIDKARVGQEIGVSYEGNLKIKEEDILSVFEIKEV
ncbi:MAG: translation initiation factor IF-2 [Patescibacteria group bacterium]